MKESKEKKDIIDLEKNHSIIEKYFERALWGTRYVVVMAAVFSTLSAITLFFIGSYEIIEAITSYCLSSLHESSNGHGHKKILASFIGGIILFASFVGAIYYFLLKILSSDLPEGLASIHILVLFGIGLNAFLLGIIGEYLLKIFLIIRSDPIAIIQETVNLTDEEIKI